MSNERFWVIGGDFSSTGFEALRSGAPEAVGPFATREAAREAWRRLSDRTRSCATTRYAIAAEQIVLPR